MTDMTFRTVLITGASSGIGATYAEKLAQRGQNLVLVARDVARLETLAKRLRTDYRVAVDVVAADLTVPAELARVEARLSEDARIGVLINNAGSIMGDGFANADPDALEQLIRLNIVAPTRLARAVTPRFLSEGGGAIVNMSSVVAVAPEFTTGIYAATKSYVLTFSQSLQAELGPRGVYVQAVLPATTRTDILQRSGLSAEAIQGAMEVGELVDAALIGFDRRETITIPTLPEIGQWNAFAAAREAMLPNFRQEHPAARYRS